MSSVTIESKPKKTSNNNKLYKFLFTSKQNYAKNKFNFYTQI